MTTTIATNGKRFYFSCGKRISRQMALELANKKRSDNRNDFTFQIEIASTYSYTSENHTYELQLDIVEGRGFTVRFVDARGFFNEIFTFDNEAEAKALVTKIEDAFIAGDLGIKINADGSTSKIDNNSDVDDYIVTTDAQEVAIDAEQQQADNNIMAIETKITKNGNVHCYLDGNRISEEDAVHFAITHDLPYYTASIHKYNGGFVSEDFISPISAYKWILKKSRYSRNCHDGSDLIRRFNDGNDTELYTEIYCMADNLQFCHDAELAAFIEQRKIKTDLEISYKELLSFVKYMTEHHGITTEQAEQCAIYHILNDNPRQDQRILWDKIYKMIAQFQAINAIETDGSEDDSDDNIFDLLPELDELNDVDDTPAKLDETAPVAYSREIARPSDKIPFRHFRIGDPYDGDVITFDGDNWTSIYSEKYGAILRRGTLGGFYIIRDQLDDDGIIFDSTEDLVSENDFWDIMVILGFCSRYSTPADIFLNDYLVECIDDAFGELEQCTDPVRREDFIKKIADLLIDLRNVNPKLYNNFAADLDELIANDEPQDTLSSVAETCAELNANAPSGWEIRFDSDHNQFPIEFNGLSVAKLDSLATLNFLSPHDFFEQFRPLVDKNYTLRQQFIDDRQREIDELLIMRDELGNDTERLKTLDDMIAQLQRDIFTAEIAE